MRSGTWLVVQLLDYLVYPGRGLALYERREVIYSLHLLRVRLRAPAVVLVFGHVEQPERDDLVLVADVARVVDPLQSWRPSVTGIPCAAELLPGARLQAAGGKHDDHLVTSRGG